MPSIFRSWPAICVVVLASALELAAQAPSAVSVTPASGSGSQQLFSFVFSDPVTWTNLQSAQIMVGPLQTASSCWTYVSGNSVYLADDSGTNWGTPLTVGTAGALQNSQCIVDAGASSISGSGINWTVNLSLMFKGAFAGTYSTWMLVYNNAGLNSGWVNRGSWTVTNTLGLSAVSVAPSSGSGSQQTFGFLFVDPAGWTHIQSAQIIIGPFQVANSCYMYINVNSVYLADDSGTFHTPLTIGTSGTQQNSQCIIDAGASSTSGSGATWTVNLALTFKPAFAGSHGTWMEVYSKSAVDSGWFNRGSWTATVVPVLTDVSVSPNSGSGASATFSEVYSDTAITGGNDIQQVWTFLRNAYAANPTDHACYVYWDKPSNQIHMVTDAGYGFGAGLVIGTPNTTLSNSQCTLDVTHTTYSISGNNLTISLPFTFTPSFAGAQQIWMSANNGTQGTLWYQLGTYTVQTVTGPTVKEYIRLGDRIIAIENH